MLMDTLPLSAATAGLKLSWASASAAAASAAAAVLPLCGPPAGVAVLLISAETAFSAVGQLSFADIWKLLVDEGSAASVLEEAIDDQICIVEEEEEEVKASALRASAPEWKPSTVTEEPMQQAPCQPCQEVAWDAHLEDPSTSVVHVRAEMPPQERRKMLNLSGPKAASILSGEYDFISLGCYCATAYALQLLDLRKNSYPFDWTRSPLQGILHSVNVGFEDFLTCAGYRDTDQNRIFLGANWGGSFWHHNIYDPKAQEEMGRQASRFLGHGDVLPETARVFVRVVNNTFELTQAEQLRQSLKMALPYARDILLLLLVELQEENSPMMVTSPEGEGIIVYTFASQDYQEAPEKDRNPLALTGARYSEAIAAAIRIWSGESMVVRIYSSFMQLSSQLYHYDGGDPAWELFAPRWVVPSKPLPRLLGSQNPDQLHGASCW